MRIRNMTVEILQIYEGIDRIEFMVDFRDSKGNLLLPYELFENDHSLRDPDSAADIFIGYHEDVYAYYEKVYDGKEKKISIPLEIEDKSYLQGIMDEFIKNNYPYNSIKEYFTR
ncbi:MAG: hypothetical protein NC347_00285 [Clostridium sp.]|nr:hypothetical protein [Clostridium sp.]